MGQQATQTRTPPLSIVQHNKLIELWRMLYGEGEMEAAAGLDKLWFDSFKHGLGNASYEEGARITGQLLTDLRAKANATDGVSVGNLRPGGVTAKTAPTQQAAEPTPTQPPDPNPSVITPEMHEAPFSWNVSAQSPEGFNEQFTVRGVTLQGFMNRVDTVKKNLTDKKYTPARRSGGTETASSTAEGETAPLCAIHHTPLTKRSKDGRSFWSCNKKLEDGTWCPYKPKS